jgi:hypothetical protein
MSFLISGENLLLIWLISNSRGSSIWAFGLGLVTTSRVWGGTRSMELAAEVTGDPTAWSVSNGCTTLLFCTWPGWYCNFSLSAGF